MMCLGLGLFFGTVCTSCTRRLLTLATLERHFISIWLWQYMWTYWFIGRCSITKPHRPGIWSPLEIVVAMHSYHWMSGVFAKRMAGDETEAGGCWGQDIRISSSQGMEGVIVPSLDCGPACVLLSGGGEQQVDCGFMKDHWNKTKWHDHESVSHWGCFPQTSLVVTTSSCEKSIVFPFDWWGDWEASTLLSPQLVGDSADGLAELSPWLVCSAGSRESILFWPSSFHPHIVLLRCSCLHPDSTDPWVISGAVVLVRSGLFLYLFSVTDVATWWVCHWVRVWNYDFLHLTGSWWNQLPWPRMKSILNMDFKKACVLVKEKHMFLPNDSKTEQTRCF